jgi:hypothetical protein
VAGRGEDRVGCIACAAFEVAACEVTNGLHVTDHGFDGGSAPELAFDDAEDAAFLPRDEDAPRVRGVVAAVSLVDTAAFDRAAGETLGGVDDGGQRVPIVGIARQRLGVQHELSSGRAGIGGDDGDLDAELVGRARLAFTDAFHLRGMEGIELPTPLTLLLGADLVGTRQRPGECGFEARGAGNLAVDAAPTSTAWPPPQGSTSLVHADIVAKWCCEQASMRLIGVGPHVTPGGRQRNGFLWQPTLPRWWFEQRFTVDYHPENDVKNNDSK